MAQHRTHEYSHWYDFTCRWLVIRIEDCTVPGQPAAFISLDGAGNLEPTGKTNQPNAQNEVSARLGLPLVV